MSQGNYGLCFDSWTYGILFRFQEFLGVDYLFLEVWFPDPSALLNTLKTARDQRSRTTLCIAQLRITQANGSHTTKMPQDPEIMTNNNYTKRDRLHDARESSNHMQKTVYAMNYRFMEFFISESISSYKWKIREHQ